ncbi:hypothetical protein [Nocardia terpenica]|uniref:Uncharacterized protein n=1 Tax=Nocardia terpenica TaxID=455432 RepID=A0A6G9ZD92_9NOCA|nr:hypothetical protein [Nocardia terpenica]QIS23472.1 hypothetical protein F6W96_39385 [Nocardia terpenica]
MPDTQALSVSWGIVRDEFDQGMFEGSTSDLAVLDFVISMGQAAAMSQVLGLPEEDDR